MGVISGDWALAAGELKGHLDVAHGALLGVHKALIDYEQVRYEREHGAIGGPNDAFALLVKDPWFAWLRPLTTLIVEIDEYVSAKQAREVKEGVGLLVQAEGMLAPVEGGAGFGGEYFRALQESAEVAGAQGEWRLALVGMRRKGTSN